MSEPTPELLIVDEADVDVEEIQVDELPPDPPDYEDCEAGG